MRIAFDYDDIYEIVSISATPCWPSESERYSMTNPVHYFVSIFHHYSDGPSDQEEILGEYMLDGSEKTYRKAQKNLKRICKKLLKKGYCKINDFKNFEFY